MIDPKREDDELDIVKDEDEFEIGEDGEPKDLEYEDLLLEEGGF